MRPFAIAGVQMAVPVHQSNVEAMLHKTAAVVGRFPWVQMIVFSELAASGPVPHDPVPLPGPVEDAFKAAAAKHGVWLIPGSIFERGEDGQIYNATMVIDPAGQVVARYRKMFPFLPYEHDVAPGKEFCVFDVPDVGRFGLSICYDIWIPETTRTLTAMGVEVLLHPVLTGTIDRDVEIAIAQATAAQFQCYVFDINGLESGGVGRSCVIDPAGTVVYQAGGHVEIVALEIDLEQVRRQREIGIRGLGQVLKSFRDRPVDFRVYDRSAGLDSFLHTLGPLQMPKRGGHAGLEQPPAGQPPLAADPPVAQDPPVADPVVGQGNNNTSGSKLAKIGQAIRSAIRPGGGVDGKGHQDLERHTE